MARAWTVLLGVALAAAVVPSAALVRDEFNAVGSFAPLWNTSLTANA